MGILNMGDAQLLDDTISRCVYGRGRGKYCQVAFVRGFPCLRTHIPYTWATRASSNQRTAACQRGKCQHTAARVHLMYGLHTARDTALPWASQSRTAIQACS